MQAEHLPLKPSIFSSTCRVELLGPWDAISHWVSRRYCSWLVKLCWCYTLLQYVPMVVVMVVVMATMCVCEHRGHQQQQHSYRCNCQTTHGWVLAAEHKAATRGGRG